MLAKNFNISAWIIIAFLIVSFCLNFIGALFKILHWPLANELLIGGVGLNLFTSVLVVYDIYSNKIFNKPFWILSMFILPTIAPIVYLIRRKELVQKDYGN
jgi:lipid-A-disaccharide synthase-like uncharacterized protein